MELVGDTTKDFKAFVKWLCHNKSESGTGSVKLYLLDCYDSVTDEDPTEKATLGYTHGAVGESEYTIETEISDDEDDSDTPDVIPATNYPQSDNGGQPIA